MVTKHCGHTKKHSVVYFKWVNCMVYGLYLNKAVFLMMTEGWTMVKTVEVVKTIWIVDIF